MTKSKTLLQVLRHRREAAELPSHPGTNKNSPCEKLRPGRVQVVPVTRRWVERVKTSRAVASLVGAARYLMGG